MLFTQCLGLQLMSGDDVLEIHRVFSSALGRVKAFYRLPPKLPERQKNSVLHHTKTGSMLVLASAVIDSQFNLCSQLNYTVSWDLEQCHGARGIASHRNKKLPTPRHHTRKISGDKGFAAEKEGGLKHIELHS